MRGEGVLSVLSYTGRGGTQCSELYRERGHSVQWVIQGEGLLSVVSYTGRGGTQCSGLYRERGYSV